MGKLNEHYLMFQIALGFDFKSLFKVPLLVEYLNSAGQNDVCAESDTERHVFTFIAERANFALCSVKNLILHTRMICVRFGSQSWSNTQRTPVQHGNLKPPVHIWTPQWETSCVKQLHLVMKSICILIYSEFLNERGVGVNLQMLIFSATKTQTHQTHITENLCGGDL